MSKPASANPFPNNDNDFDGETYERPRDFYRLNRQAQAVYDYVCDGAFYSLAEISKAVRAPEASVSARLRDLRKDKFGGHIVIRKSFGGGLHKYRLVMTHCVQCDAWAPHDTSIGYLCNTCLAETGAESRS